MKMWVFNCREVSRLVSESMDRDLSLVQKMGIRFHLMMCKYCARFGQQLARIRKVIRGQGEETVTQLTMDPTTKAKLKQVLKKTQ